MKIFYSLVFVALFFSTQAVFAVSYPECSLTLTLRLGSKGIEVQCLQNKLGVATDGKFGPMTQAAVKVFQQNKGLKADGIVGPLSRAAFNTIIPTTASSSPVNPSPQMESLGVNPIVTNPNMQYLDKTIEIVTQVSKNQGFSDQQITDTTKAITEKFKNSIKDFFEELQEANEKSLTQANSSKGLLSRIFDKTLSFIGIKPTTAHAFIGGSFGGAILTPFPCLEGNFALTITPLPPSGVALLSYYPGTQAFPNFNLPAARFLLGLYTPPISAAGYGPTDCMITPPLPPAFVPVFFPTEGLITPVVGSSI